MGRQRGIEKEQALSFLDNPDTQHMSYQFSPNPNKTLYNTIFEMYAHGQMNLELSQVEPYIRTVEAAVQAQRLQSTLTGAVNNLS